MPADEFLTYESPDGAYRIACPRAHWASLNLGAYEPTLRRVLLDRLIQPGTHFVDGGANVGIYTIPAALRVGPSGSVLAIEPHDGIRSVLVANLKKNAVSNVRVHQGALGSTARAASLFEAKEMGSHSLWIRPEGSSESSLVTIETLDNLVRDEPVDVVKLDCEGAEFDILLGMEGIVGRQNAPVLVLECDDELLRWADADTAKILGWLRARNYRTYGLHEPTRTGPIALSSRADLPAGSITIIATPVHAPDWVTPVKRKHYTLDLGSSDSSIAGHISEYATHLHHNSRVQPQSLHRALHRERACPDAHQLGNGDRRRRFDR
ncbi:MAG: FkbM family methyltransferase [Gemmatimonadaceae bacterium]